MRRSERWGPSQRTAFMRPRSPHLTLSGSHRHTAETRWRWSPPVTAAPIRVANDSCGLYVPVGISFGHTSALPTVVVIHRRTVMTDLAAATILAALILV